MRHSELFTTVVRKVQPASYRFHTRAYDQVQGIFVTRGRLQVREHKSEESRTLPAGGFVLLRRKGAFTLSCAGEGYEGIGVVMQGTENPALTGPPLAGVSDSRLRMLEGLIRRHMDAPLPESAQVLPRLGEALIWEALILFRERRSPRGSDWAEAARTAIELNLGAGVSVREALASLPLSYRQAARCFRERFGVSPKEYQELLRVQEVCRLLTSTTLDVTAIANELGFSSSQHLATRFRKRTGTTPGAYRKTGQLPSQKKRSGEPERLRFSNDGNALRPGGPRGRQAGG